jgi:hypothetical protein
MNALKEYTDNYDSFYPLESINDIKAMSRRALSISAASRPSSKSNCGHTKRTWNSIYIIT